MKKVLFLLSFLCLYVAASFATALSGEYRIGGAGASYATLSAACADLRANGLSGDVTFLICADINEVSNIGITNTSEYTLTIRPDAAVKRTIDFGTIADNAGPSGHVVIGYDLAGWPATETQNVVIDGAFEGDGQYLEFRGGTKGGVVVVYYGHVTESVVKNCRLISPRTSGTTYVAHFRTEQLAGGTPSTANKTDNAPEGVGFENCYMQVTGVTNAQAVYFNGTNSKTSAGKPKDCFLRGCEIVSNLRGVFFSGAINATFENNTFRFPAASHGYLAHGIMSNSQSGTIIVRGNKFIELKTTNSSAGAYGINAITAAGGSTTWIIENNYFGGLDATAAGAAGKAIQLLYVSCGNYCTCELRHNTFYMPSLSKKPSTEMTADAPITCVHIASGSPIIQNNIFVSAETTANNSLIRGNLNDNVKNNVFYHAGGNCAINAASATKKTWEEFTAGGANARSRWKQPTFVNAAEGNLAIAIADKDLKMPRLSGVLNDITGASRANLTNAGAFELTSPLAGEYNIGSSTADFSSLASAIEDKEICGISDDVTFRICDDLTETVNTSLVNTTEHSIKICPDAAVKRTITYNSPDNEGPSGHIMIGYNMTGWASTDTKNVIIDGSFENDGQYLEFRGGDVGGVVVVYYGHVTNSVVKNCRLISPRTSKTTYVVHFRSERSSDKAPIGVGFENCYMQVTGVTNAQAVYFNGSESSTAAGKPKDCYLRGCEIVSNLRGVFLNGAIDPIFESNTFRINGGTGYAAHGILGSSQSGTITIRGNKFTELATNQAATETTYGHGIRGITAEGGSTTWIIENNYFGGLNAKAAGAAGKEFGMMYVRCGNLCTCELRHNTFFLPSLTNKPATPLTSTHPITCVFVANGSPIIKNNLFVSEETTANNSLIRGALNSNVQGNVFYHAGGNAAVVAGDPTYTAFSDLPSTYQSTNKSQQVAFEAGTYIITDEYANNINLGVEHIANFNYDIEGNTRNTPTRAGCYDPAWSITLDQTANNDAVLTDFDNILVDATLKRPFIADGGWYTLVLPFDVTAGQIAEAFGAGTEVAVLQNSRWKSADEMYLNFQKQATIEAGVPCLIKPTETIASEVTFHDVTIDKELTEIETDLVNMIGFYKPTTITLDDDNYYLGNSNLLYEYNTEYASSYATPNGFRAYFHFDFTPPAGCAARVVFHEDTTTGIEESPETQAPAATKVIREGQLLIIRDGKEYNAQGQLVR